MKVYFRADASSIIGAGHVIRCATLAQVLHDRGAKVTFICRNLDGNYVSWLKEKGFFVELLPAHSVENKIIDISSNKPFGVSFSQEIADTVTALQGEKMIDWLITDHYGIDDTWHKSLRGSTQKIMCIDDLANRSFDCDVLLDQNLQNTSKNRYSELLSFKSRKLLGPQYALLRPEFEFYRKKIQARDGIIRRIFIFMGGGDCSDILIKILTAIVYTKKTNIPIDVVVGKQLSLFTINNFKSKLPNLVFHYRVDSIAKLMIQADLAIGATGVSTWERASLGLPTLAISIADNQRLIASNAHEAGLLTWIGHKDVSMLKIAESINELFAVPDLLRQQSQACIELVDGKGVYRVAEVLQ